MLRIFINTWGNYNVNGAEGGRWIDLPMPEAELDDVLEDIAAKMGDDDPEWAIHDYEWTTHIKLDDISEYSDIYKLNEICQEAEDLDEYDLEVINAAIEAWGVSFQEALEHRDDYIFYKGQTLEDVAYDLVEECYFTHETPEIFRTYFDYASFARDLSFEGYNEVSNGVIFDR